MIKKSILVHTCCGVCALNVIEELKSDYNIALYFFNPNIHPESEYLKRKKYLMKYADDKKIEVIEDDYDPNIFFDLVEGYENEPEGGKRCSICFKYRLEQTASKAAETGYELFTTTLTISPHKNAAIIFKIAKEISNQTGIEYLERNFKKQNGFIKTIALAKELGFYIQNYCGCIFSKQEREKKTANKY
mgnify:CR=1 FL=1